MPQDCKFQVNKVVRVHLQSRNLLNAILHNPLDAYSHPILGGLAHECTLITTCTGIALHRMATGADEVIQLGELHYEAIPIVLVKRTLLQISMNECGFQRATCLFLCMIMRRQGWGQRNTGDFLHLHRVSED